MKRITIIGGGASGTLVAINLLKNSGTRPIEVNLVERSRSVGRGVAYALGLNATRKGKIINHRNEVSKVISTLGTAMKGILWESTAMPEIRLQARRLALDLLSE